MDSILHSKEAATGDGPQQRDTSKRVLIAPSWGENGLTETCGLELVEVLLRAGHQVTFRPHTMTIRQRPKLLKQLGQQFGSHPDFHLELDLKSQGTVDASDIMISDWSGAPLEYAFGLERPVLFVDVPRKVNNPEYEKIPCVPIEVNIRSEIGKVVSPDRIADVPELVEILCRNPDDWKERIRVLRSHWIYNVGTSGKVSATYIAKAAEMAGVAGPAS